MPVFRRSVDLPAPLPAVFAFHENPHAIREISPGFLQILDVKAQPTAAPGETFILKLRIFGVPLTWHGTWAEVEKPTLLVDVAGVFPFQDWRHEHRFEAIATGTRMTDVVTYKITGGPLGWLVGQTVFRVQLLLMFIGRHGATRKYFSDSTRL